MSSNSSNTHLTPILDSLKSTKDLKSLSIPELESLCAELRSDLIHRVNQTGGHFASSLGVTELTVALHYFFNTPEDKIVWDVGHQAYVHKILTGRREEMLKVRTYGGISGFPKRSESKYDTFGVAHAGTSISAALGMAEAFHLKNSNQKAVAVIGDGAMTAGMAFEALNHSGQIYKNLIVVLNDNEMSIAPNVGAISLAFSRAITTKLSTSARRHFKNLTEKGLIPKTLYRALDKAEEATQGFFSTPAMLFSSFGFRYIGPIDGHNIPQLIDAFSRAKDQDGPVLIHALTTKGKGYSPAEEDPVGFHAISANQLDIDIAKINTPNKKTNKTYTQIFGETLLEICTKNKNVIGITAAMPDGTGLSYIAKNLPDQFYDVGIAEQHAVTFAAGLACEGIRPVCAIYSTFLQRAYDQVVHDVCIQNIPVIFVLDRAGLVGSDGPTHHGVFDLSYLRSLPNMTIMSPANEIELNLMTHFSIDHLSGPIALRYPRGTISGVTENKSINPIELGKGEIVESDPSAQVALLAVGPLVQSCIEAKKILNSLDVQCTIVNMRFIKPLDQELLSKIATTHEYLFTLEDNSILGGFGSAVLEKLNELDYLSLTNLTLLGIPDHFIEHGTQSELYNEIGLDPSGIANSVISRIAKDQALVRNVSGFEKTKTLIS
jgi:1-deoxy-D-xylulose-5-phosphate synthase